MPLLVHGEVTDAEIDIFDREKVFIETKLAPVVKQFPSLKVVLEHITTRDAVEFVNEQGPNVAATITAHHLLRNRNDMLVGGIRPHLYCLPILKRQEHQAALLVAATSGSPKFFLGTDSALYAEAFEMRDQLDRLEGFASFHGPDFYGLPRNEQKITLVKEEWQMPKHLTLGNDKLVPFCAEDMIQWKLKADQ